MPASSSTTAHPPALPQSTGLPYTQTIDAVARQLDTDTENGLSPAEVNRRLKRYGPNELRRYRPRRPLRILIGQFANPIVWMLIAAAALALGFGEILEGVAVGVVILINTLIGFFMEWQADRSMNKLRELSRAATLVIRHGRRIRIDSAQLAPGDLLYLEAGDMVTADARVVEENNLAIKEAALTGESTQVEKETEPLAAATALSERNNMVFSGTVVTRGNARAIVTATGHQTELGRIADMISTAEKEATPLDKKLAKLSRRLIWLTLGLALLILVMGMLGGRDIVLMVKTAIALAVAAIPEGLPVIATVALARGMLRLARKKVIVKTLRAVETLGEANVIFTDKTGTLTENRMTARELITREGAVDLNSNIPYLPTNDPVLKWVVTVGVLCNDSHYDPAHPEEATGDPIEIALHQLAERTGLSRPELEAHHPRISEIPFDSNLKMMATLHRTKEGKQLVCVKGAAEAVLEKSTQLLLKDEPAPLRDKTYWLDQVDQLAGRGLRLLSFAYRETDAVPEAEIADGAFVHDLVFLGLVAFLDPARTEVRPAIEACHSAGIKVVMVTGDHPETARNISKQVGLVPEPPANAILGKELGAETTLSDEQRQRMLHTHIFARVSPAQKLDLVKVHQKAGYITAMTGDGVNDAPALKKADIGIAMGQRGTEAAKEAADIVLRDDAFSSIVLAIKQGRIIFGNIRQFVVYLLSCNLSEILVVAAASFANLPMPLLPLQILFLNMVTDVFPALALGLDEGEEDIMQQPPRPPQEAIVPRRLWVAIAGYGLSITLPILGITIYSSGYTAWSDATVNNLAFYSLVLAQLWHVFNLPSKSANFWFNEVTRNRYVWLAILLCILLVAIAFALLPVRQALTLEFVTWQQMLLVIGFSLAPVFIIQVLKRGLKWIH